MGSSSGFQSLVICVLFPQCIIGACPVISPFLHQCSISPAKLLSVNHHMPAPLIPVIDSIQDSIGCDPTGVPSSHLATNSPHQHHANCSGDWGATYWSGGWVAKSNLQPCLNVKNRLHPIFLSQVWSQPSKLKLSKWSCCGFVVWTLAQHPQPVNLKRSTPNNKILMVV